MDNPILIYLIIFLPLVVLPLGLLWRSNRSISIAGTSILGITMILSLYVFFSGDLDATTQVTFNWMMDIKPGLLLNPLTALLLVVVSVVSFLVHLFSMEYMKNDEAIGKYYGFLGLFTFSMLGLVTANNLLQLFVCWELVGFSSYLLIGFWFTKDSAAQAARKAFIVNRIGDIGVLIAILIVYSELGTLYFEDIAYLTIEWNTWMVIAGFGLLIGAIGKSAQFPLFVWLPDAMEGPTPVSALIHAATMVAAGIFLLARGFVLLDPIVLDTAAFVGALTAILAGCTALFQHDIKKVLAYSTVSQLGYMMVAIGVGTPDMALFHLTTHAFFKACLFLSAGAVIHSLHHMHSEGFDPQDMRWMGGLRKKLPVTFWAFVIAGMALAGLPFFSGFLSKDAIITNAFVWAEAKGMWYFAVPDLAIITAFLTAIYIGRLLVLVFFGKSRIDLSKIGKEHVLQSVPLIALAIGSFGLAFSFNPFDTATLYIDDILQTLNFSSVGMLERSHELHFLFSMISGLLALSGLAIAYLYFGPRSKYASQYEPDFAFTRSFYQYLHDSWKLNEIYQLLFVRSFERLSSLVAGFDEKVVDKTVKTIGVLQVVGAHLVGMVDMHLVDGIVNLIARFAGGIGQVTRRIQSRQVQMQFIWALIGLSLIIIWVKYF